MKFLFRSRGADSLSLARRVEAEGNDVLFWISNPEMKHVGDGFVDKTTDLKSVEWADVIVFDGNGKGLPEEAEAWRKSKPVVGTSAFADKLEHDRIFGIETAKRAGIAVPEFKPFKSFDKARRFLEKQDADSGWVLKPDADAIRTHVARDVEEMLRMLDFFEHRFEAEKVPVYFLLEKVVEGIEVSTEAWFDGSEFFLPNGTIEENKMFEHDLGEQTGCAGNVVWCYSDVGAPLVQHLLEPLKEVLNGKYRGPVDVNSIISREDGRPHFLEFTPRFGYSAIYALCELVSDVGQLLADCAMGRAYDGRVDQRSFAVGLRASIPPYPVHAADKKAATGYPVFEFDPKKVDRHVSPSDLLINEDGNVETVGADGIVFEFTATGPTIPEASKALYEVIDGGPYVPNMRYRKDIGGDAAKEFEELKGLGLVEDPTPSSVFDEYFRRKRA